MGKHKADKLSERFAVKHNKAGSTPQAPKAGSTAQNQYRYSSS